jgi:ABC-type transporter Mla subunit MlaD
MMHMTFDLGTILSMLGLAGYVIAGVFAFRGQWDKSSKNKDAEADALSDKLIQRLQQTVDQSEKSVATLSAKLEQTTKELHQMQGRNQVLESLFNGSENSIMAFLKQAPVLVKMTGESNQLAKDTSASIDHLASTFAKFIDNLQPILIHIEQNSKAPAGVE